MPDGEDAVRSIGGWMEKNENITEAMRRTSGESPQIEDRLREEGDRSPQSIESAAEDAFVADQRDPDHPSRKQRELDREHGIEHPSHSQGF
jgi:hypothetical protein